MPDKRRTLREVPIRDPFFQDEQHAPITETWTRFFQLCIASGLEYAADTNARRSLYEAGRFVDGSLFYVSDRDVYYIARAGVWKYFYGTMRAALASIPAGLGADDTGFLFYSTNYVRTWRWTGSAWDYAPGERLHKEIAWYPGTLPNGWALCDGSAVTVSTAAGATASFTTPDLTGQYPKGGVYDGSVVSAVPGTLTGGMDPAGAHNHGGTATGNTGANNSSVAVQSGAGTTVAADGHIHSASVTINAALDHIHGNGTLAVTQSEPAHVLLLPIVKL